MNLGRVVYWFAGLWASSLALCVVTGMAYSAQYHPLMVTGAMGLVWCMLQYHDAGRCRAIDYTVLGVCVLLGAGSYSGIKDVVAMPDVAGIILVVSGLSALVMIVMLTIRSVTPRANDMLQT